MHTSPDMLEHLGRVAEESARAAGAVALSGFRSAMEVRSKGRKDLVTEFDTAAEDRAVAVIKRHFPEHGILAEESGASYEEHATPRYLWAIDPIDGTHNYAMQLPYWCCSVAVIDSVEKVVLAAAVCDPLHEETFLAKSGHGAFLNGQPMKVAALNDLEDATLAFDIGYDPHVSGRMLSLATKVQPQVRRVRLLGSAVLALTYVAAGRFDAYYHLNLNPWDIAAASLLVKEAGGLVTDWEGKTAGATGGDVAAANPNLHPQLLHMLRSSE
ncbi:MAG: inositol monophosphatase [Chloroflexota bacterium]|nr:inositol monophosphatase [Chloroflexota bacterium]MDQ5864526.1 inositol monophosphatase [Chloroflexota bacterium]